MLHLQNADNKLITYSSCGHSTYGDCIMVRSQYRVNLQGVQVIPGEEVVSQHKLVVCDMRVKGVMRACQVRHQPRMKIRKSKEVATQRMLSEKLEGRSSG